MPQKVFMGLVETDELAIRAYEEIFKIAYSSEFEVTIKEK